MAAVAETSRDEILADFQSCTGIDDVGEAILHLEESDWDLVNAINRALPQHTQTLPSEREVFVDADIEMSEPQPPPPPLPKTQSSTNHVHKREVPLLFNSSTSQLPQGSTNQSQHTEIKTTASNSKDLNRRIGVVDLTDGSDTSSDVEDFTESFPLEDDFIVPEAKQPPQRFLISENVADEETGTILFSESFVGRYGHCHPMFFHGTLDNAVREATHRPAKDRRLLAVYLHHDGSVLSNVFCQQVLCAESIVGYLTQNFVVWGWDVTNEGNRQLLLASMNKSFGLPGVGTIRSLDKDRYPVILLISRRGSSTEICSVIHVTVGVDELMVSLIHAHEMYRAQQTVDIHEEEEREAREGVIREQNAAYEESLRADMAKDEAKRTLEFQKQNQELERVAQIARETNERDRLKEQLPSEPKSDCTDSICSLKVRVPGGKFVARKFLQSTTLKILYDYLFTEGYSKDEYKFLFSYPKRDLCETHPETQILGNVFSSQDTLIVEKR